MEEKKIRGEALGVNQILLTHKTPAHRETLEKVKRYAHDERRSVAQAALYLLEKGLRAVGAM